MKLYGMPPPGTRSSRAVSPIVILGAARSGTKFLRGVLAAAPGHVATPFDSNHVWRIGNAGAADDELDPASISDRTARVIRDALWKLAVPGGVHDGGTLVEKTVSNSLRPDFVERVLPEARYILLIRDGRDVIESTFRMWQAPPDAAGLRQKLASLPVSAIPYAAWYGVNMVMGKLRGRGVGVWGVRYRGIAQDLERLSVPEVCAHQWRTCVESSLRVAQKMDSSRFIQLRYEDLIADEAALDPVAEFLQVTSHGRDCLRSALRRTIRAPERSRWTETFDEAARVKVLAAISTLQTRLGYPDQ
ncbi:MAG: sulfotransferase [Proteobacteria bacterium]|nr:sulfotransferase [Pseudomonadota bacterium]